MGTTPEPDLHEPMSEDQQPTTTAVNPASPSDSVTGGAQPSDEATQPDSTGPALTSTDPVLRIQTRTQQLGTVSPVQTATQQKLTSYDRLIPQTISLLPVSSSTALNEGSSSRSDSGCCNTIETDVNARARGERSTDETLLLIGVGGGSCILVLLITILTTAACCLLRRHKRQKRQGKPLSSPTTNYWHKA